MNGFNNKTNIEIEKYRGIAPIMTEYKDLTEEQKRKLPPIPKGYEGYKNPPFAWMGYGWDYIMRD